MTDPTPTKTARPSEESLAFAMLNAAVDRADRAEAREYEAVRGRDAAIARAIAAEARAIASEAREREISEELDKATGMVEMHVGDAEAARLLWRSSEKACAHMDAQRAAARADRDAAQQMVAQLRETLTTGRDIVIETSRRHTQWVEQAYDTIEAAAPIANRWCLASERDASERRESELGLQVVAQAARLRLADGLANAVKEEARKDDRLRFVFRDALAAWDESKDAYRAAEARAIAAEAENSRLRHAALEVLAWSLTDTTALLTNPPQNAALFHAQRLLREAMGD